MSRRKKAAEEEVNTEAWLAIYCDAITLLLTFFILLYATANVDEEKYNSISNALKGQFTGEQVLSNGSGGSSAIEDLIIKDNEKANLKQELENMIEEKNIGTHVSLKEDSRGVLLELTNSILFDSGKYNLKQEGIDILHSIYELIADINKPIMVEGHTDDIKHAEGELSNWELSTFRATSVVRYFVEDKGMDPSLFSATGHGEYKPIVENSTAENRAKNRRVEILITTKQGEDK